MRTRPFPDQSPLVYHVDGDAHGGARLHDVEMLLLDGEFDVLHVVVVAFQALDDVHDLFVDGSAPVPRIEHGGVAMRNCLYGS